tara:strand:+ start:504 stop:731 length:228 start_codon:yes stop_codon:yes gene_type:complete
MNVEGQVSSVHRETIGEACTDPLANNPCKWNLLAPKQSMVHKYELAVSVDCSFDCRLRGVNRQCYPANFFGTFNL